MCPSRSARPTATPSWCRADAQALIAGKQVDRRLFDVTELNRAATRASQKQGLKVIVGYKGAATAARAGCPRVGHAPPDPEVPERGRGADAAAGRGRAVVRGHRPRAGGLRHRARLAGRRAQGEPRQVRAADRRPQGLGRRVRRQGRQDRRPRHRCRRDPPGPQEPGDRVPELLRRRRRHRPLRPRHARRVHRGGHRCQVEREVQGRSARRQDPQRQGPRRHRKR